MEDKHQVGIKLTDKEYGLLNSLSNKLNCKYSQVLKRGLVALAAELMAGETSDMSYLKLQELAIKYRKIKQFMDIMEE